MGRFFTVFLADISNDNLRALFRQRYRIGPSQPRTTTGHQANFVFDSTHLRILLYDQKYRSTLDPLLGMIIRMALTECQPSLALNARRLGINWPETN
jgi:hypothetical protein